MKCDIHPSRAGTHICLTCGRWYCAECMAQSSPLPLCQRCAGPSVATVLSQPFKSGASLRTLLTSPLALVGILGATASSFILGIAVQAVVHSAIGYVPLGLMIILDLGYLIWRINSSGQNKHDITWPQVETMLRLHNGRITASVLAGATGCSEDQATRYLNSLVVESVLSVSSNSRGLVYSRPEISDSQ